MKVTIEHEKTFFNYYLSHPQLLKQLGPGFFSNPDIDHVAKIAKDFYIKFGESPSRDQTLMLISDDPNEISPDIVNAVYSSDWKKYEKDWVKRTAEAWIQWRHFNKQLIRTIEFVKTQDVSPENVEDVVGRAINMISTDGSISFDADVSLSTTYNERPERSRPDGLLWTVFPEEDMIPSHWSYMLESKDWVSRSGWLMMRPILCEWAIMWLSSRQKCLAKRC